MTVLLWDGTTIGCPALHFILTRPAKHQCINFTNLHGYNRNFEFGFSFGLDFVRLELGLGLGFGLGFGFGLGLGFGFVLGLGLGYPPSRENLKK